MRLGDRPRVLATTTPRNSPLMQRLKAEARAGKVAVANGRTTDNRGVLPADYLAAMIEQFAASNFGRQELDGEMIDAVEGALWNRELLERCRTPPRYGEGDHPQDGGGAGLCDPDSDRPDTMPAPLHPRLRRRSPSPLGGGYVRTVVGVDPPAGARGDACGIVVCALGADGIGHVLADCSVERASPERWARAVANAARAWHADRVVAEVNQGGQMVESVLRAADLNLPIRPVHASKGKVPRAEPVAALYEAGRVRHAGLFARLEDEMCGLMAGGRYEGPGRSPDRADALVYALTELMLGRVVRPRISVL